MVQLDILSSTSIFNFLLLKIEKFSILGNWERFCDEKDDT